MYVRWKVLIGLGTAFWLLLCLLDYLPIRHIDHLILHKEHNVKIQQEIVQTPEPTKKNEGHFGFVKVIFWNLVAFASTITVCFILKSISNKLNIINNQSLLLGQNDKLTVRKGSSSRIPIPITSKTSSTDIHIEGVTISTDKTRETEFNKSCPDLLRLQDLEEKPKLENKGDKRIWSIRIMEKHCSKLREEMINLQTASIKEQAAVTRKMEALTKEKKDLMKQFNVITKENKSLKQQIEDMLEERTLLIKRLECATKEMKNATKNKKATVAKLDEAVANAEALKHNLEQIKRDKNVLEDKLIILDAEYRRLKGEVELHKHKEKELEKALAQEEKIDETIKEYIEKYDAAEKDKNVLTQTKGSEYDVCKSEEDIKKVQQKLLTLEKSLENFKLRHESKEIAKEINKEGNKSESETPKSDEPEVPTLCLFSESNSKVIVEEQPSAISICTEPDCPLEHKECLRAECFLKRKMEETDISSSGEDIKQLINYREYLTLKKRLPKLKSSISDDRLSVISELATSTGDESGDDWCEPKRRFLTHSPAFQKFFRETLEAQKKCGSKSSVNSGTK